MEKDLFGNLKVQEEIEKELLGFLLSNKEYMEYFKDIDISKTKYPIFWGLYKSIYNKYKTIDTTLIVSCVGVDIQKRIIENLKELLLNCSITFLDFNTYKNKLFDFINGVDNLREKLIYEQSTKLLVGEIDLEEYYNFIDKLRKEG